MAKMGYTSQLRRKGTCATPRWSSLSRPQQPALGADPAAISTGSINATLVEPVETAAACAGSRPCGDFDRLDQRWWRRIDESGASPSRLAGSHLRRTAASLEASRAEAGTAPGHGRVPTV